METQNCYYTQLIQKESCVAMEIKGIYKYTVEPV